ncbi:MAG: hypothetical protein PHU21_15115, partial [Elusimicrobia bacterium]|nr:hypothetical protein [Elusimicrobiota bacterium]
AVRPFDLEGRQAGDALVLPGPPEGREDRAYALAFADDATAWVTGFSKDPEGRRLLALWRVGPR